VRADENKEQSKGVRRWMIFGAALLIGGALTAILWLHPPMADPGTQDLQTSGTSQNMEDPIVDPENTEPTEPTTGSQTTVPTTEATVPAETFPNGTSDEVQQTPPVEPDGEQTVPSVPVPPEQLLICENIGLYNGAFVEDGSDEPVQNVAALLVTNGSEQYLDLAKLTYEIDGQEAVFLVMGLPAGGTAWVLESSRRTASAQSEFRHKNTVTSFRDNAVNRLEGVDLEFNGTMLRATNTTDKTFKALTVYYKVLHDDGNYLGGIAYMVTFGDLEPGESVEKIAGHFQSDKTHIVRIGYQQA
jgi:hypothetical protein